MREALEWLWTCTKAAMVCFLFAALAGFGCWVFPEPVLPWGWRWHLNGFLFGLAGSAVLFGVIAVLAGIALPAVFAVFFAIASVLDGIYDAAAWLKRKILAL